MATLYFATGIFALIIMALFVLGLFVPSFQVAVKKVISEKALRISAFSLLSIVFIEDEINSMLKANKNHWILVDGRFHFITTMMFLAIMFYPAVLVALNINKRYLLAYRAGIVAILLALIIYEAFLLNLNHLALLAVDAVLSVIMFFQYKKKEAVPPMV